MTNIRRTINLLIPRLLNLDKRWDYLFAAAIAAVPILVSVAIGAEHSIAQNGTVYRGYLASYNWLAFVLIFPAALYIVRLVMFRLGGSSIKSGSHDPPVIQLMVTRKTDRLQLINDFRNSVFHFRSLIYSVIVTVFINILDMREVIGVYVNHWSLAQPIARERDWSVIFLTGHVPAAENLCLVFSAYLVQSLVAILAFWLIFMLAGHNHYFLSRIYQRRFSGQTARPSDIVINLSDPNQCFGFRPAYGAFNTQVLFLSAVGVLALVSRFINVDIAQTNAIYDAIGSIVKILKADVAELERIVGALNIHELFPDVGQVILALAWLAIFFVVAMPSLVKLLPFLGRHRIEWLIEAYLREMLPDKNLAWKNAQEPTEEEVNVTAASFARNSFWPTGDNRAKVLFFFSFFVFLVLICPLEFDSSRLGKFFSYYTCLIAISWALTTIFLKTLHFPLKYVDVRLAEVKK